MFTHCFLNALNMLKMKDLSLTHHSFGGFFPEGFLGAVEEQTKSERQQEDRA